MSAIIYPPDNYRQKRITPLPIGTNVTVSQKRSRWLYERNDKSGKRESKYVIDYITWEGIITEVRTYNRNLSIYKKSKFPMLLETYDYYYMVKQGSYHCTRVEDLEIIKPEYKETNLETYSR